MSQNDFGFDRTSVNKISFGAYATSFGIGVLAAACWYLLASGLPGRWSSLEGGAVAIGICFSLATFALLVQDALSWWGRKKELLQFHGNNASKSVWSTAFVECQESARRQAEGEIPRIFARQKERWMDLTAWNAGQLFTFALVPMFIGMIHSHRVLDLSLPGSGVGSFFDTYFPSIVGFTVSFVLGTTVSICRWSWHSLFSNWTSIAEGHLQPSQRQREAYEQQQKLSEEFRAPAVVVAPPTPIQNQGRVTPPHPGPANEANQAATESPDSAKKPAGPQIDFESLLNQRPGKISNDKIEKKTGT